MVRRRPVLSAVLGTVAGILILASGCVDQNPTAVQLDPITVSAKSPLVGTQANVLFSVGKAEAATVSALITREGGTLNFGIGSINFPADAVSHPTRITARVDGQSMAVTFGPHGVFPTNSQPVITFSYAGIDVDPSRLQIAYRSESTGRIIEVLETSVDPTTTSASGNVPHFSQIILAAN